MFSSTGLFKNIACPQGERCQLLTCIFSHELRPKQDIIQPASVPNTAKDASDADVFEDRGAKRRKLANRRTEDTASPLHDGTKAAATVTKVQTTPAHALEVSNNVSRPSAGTPQTLRKAVSPPPVLKGTKTKAVSAFVPPSKPKVKETLNPRMIPHDPAGHAKRTLYLKHMYEQTKRLNVEVEGGSHDQKSTLLLDENELIKAALDEEEQMARENANVYSNVIKNRIAAYKKMRVDDWIKHIKTTLAKHAEKPQTAAKKPVPVLDTGLRLRKEHVLLPRLITNQAPLAAHGYVTSPPSAADIAEARATVALAHNYEVCDRCSSRFQVFPDRREEDGALTTGGACVHHWGRKFMPKREKTDAIQGAREAVYTCCNELLNSKGCTMADTHVFKIHDAKRMALVMPFIGTPANPHQAKNHDGEPPKAVTFDCEMGYTVCGLELIRLTAVSWPQGNALVDVLVRPQGAILDLNSRFSGVWPDTYSAAVPYNHAAPLTATTEPAAPLSECGSGAQDTAKPLPIVASPAAARDILCSYLTPDTPLIGHALENDLNSVRLCHPRIIDTVALFPHPRGLPLRFGLKNLTKQHLGRDIQMGGAMGHDSLEDARATGDLVRWMVGQRWADMKRDGWSMKGEELVPPLSAGLPPPSHEHDVPQVGGQILGGGSGVKTQHIRFQGGTVGEGT